MVEANPGVSTYEELKDYSATMGMFLFSLMYDKPVPQKGGLVELGISICDALNRVSNLTTSGATTFEDLTAGEAFSRLTDREKSYPGELPSMEQEALVVKEILTRIRDGENISSDELDKSAAFFSRVYVAT